MTYRIRGVEEQLAVGVYERFLGDDQKLVQNSIGEGLVSYAPEFEDGEEHFIAVPLMQAGTVSGSLSLRVQLVQELKPVTSGPSISQYLLDNLYKTPHDVLQNILDFFEVDGENKNHEERVDALAAALDDIERRHGEKLTAIYEKEASVDPDARPQAPSLGARAVTKIGQLVSSAPRFMIPHIGWFSSDDTRDLLVKWVTCREEIAVRAEEMGKFLNHQGKVLAGIGIFGNMFDMTRWMFDVATVVTLLIPETGGNCAVYGMTSEALGVGSGTVGVITYYIATNSANNSQRSLFQVLAQENALHRKAYFALHGRAGEEAVEDEPTEDLPLDELPSDAKLDEHLEWSGNETVNLLSDIQNAVTDTLTMVADIQSIVGTRQVFKSKNGSGNGDPLLSLAKEYGYDGKSPEEVADLMLADPKQYVVSPPAGMVLYDVRNTVVAVRMVVREKGKTRYFETQKPITLAGTRCEVYFQVNFRDKWVDVKEWDGVSHAQKIPLKKQVYKVNGKKDFRWFHLEGPYPVRVVGVDDENGPMQ